MKKLMLALAAMFVAATVSMAGVSFAAEYGKETKGEMKGGMMGESKSMSGYIIDTKCASGREAKGMAQKEAMDEFVRTHSKECVLTCEMGGCKFYSDGRLWDLDKESSDRIISFLKQPDSTLHIKAEVVPAEKGDKVKLMNIENAM